MGSFSSKLLRVKFTLSNGATFPGDPNKAANVLELTGLRISAQISCQGAPAFPQGVFAIYGMAQSDMNALSALTYEVTGITRNTIQIDSNDGSGSGWTTVYAGQIVSGFADYQGAPEVPFRVTAQMGFFDQINPATATSYTGPTPAATIISAIAAKMGFAFENHGVATILPGAPYFPGTLTDQLRDAVLAAGIDQYMEAGATVQTIAICPKGQARDVPTFNLSPSSGLQGYPKVDSRGYITAVSLYNPAFRFGGPLTISGSDVVIDSNVPATINSKANGKWLIGQLSHNLESLVFGGKWFSEMLLYPPGQEPPQS